MKKTILLATLVLGVVSATQAGVRVGLGFTVPLGAPAPVYTAPPPVVYSAPAPVYQAPPPVVYAPPAPVYVAPPVYYPPSIYLGFGGWGWGGHRYYGGWGHHYGGHYGGWGHHGWHR